MAYKLEDFKYQNTVPTNEHIVTYNLELKFRTFDNDGETIRQELKNKEDIFNEMQPTEQIQFLLQLAIDLSEDSTLEYEAKKGIDITRMLRTTFKVKE